MEAVVVDPPAESQAIASTWRTTVLRTCIQCGMCSGVCPFGYLMEFPPSRMISALRANVYGTVTGTETVWMCISCSACSSACPVQIPVTEDLMTRTKEEMLLAGKVPTELQTALENSQRYGNPLGESPRKRIDWTRGLDFSIPVLGKDTRTADILWFVGDYPAYHPRVQKTALAFARILHAMGINFAILGNDEQSDGDSQRLAGERGLFEVLAMKNGKAMGKGQFGEIITTDPHAFNAFKNIYPSLGIQYPIRHYTQFLADNLPVLKPLLVKSIDTAVTFHDPCYLGRVNGIFEAPRTVLKSIPGLTFREMPHNHKNSLCCGGGGGGMWMDGYQWDKAHTRTSEWRVMEAVKTGVSVLAVACPYETPRFEDAAKTVKGAANLKVKDISELLVEAL